jgi:hypothetical protein
MAEVLVTMGRIKGAQGERTAARASLTEALALAWAKGPRAVLAAALEEVGVQAVGQGQVEHGVRLLAGAAALRQAMGAPVRPADRQAVEDALAAARTALGGLPFEEAWQRGRSLPLEQIVARVVAGSKDGPAEPEQSGESGQMDHTDTEAPASHPLS